MTSRRERLLQSIDPEVLKITPKLSVGSDSFVELDSGKETLQKGAKDLMLRFLRRQETIFQKNTKNGIDIYDNAYHESYKFCQTISKRLSVPFDCGTEFKLDRPGKKLQDLKKILEEKMSKKRKEEYHKRVDEYKKWKEEMDKKNKNLESEEEFCDESGDDGDDEKEEDIANHDDENSLKLNEVTENTNEVDEDKAGDNGIENLHSKDGYDQRIATEKEDQVQGTGSIEKSCEQDQESSSKESFCENLGSDNAVINEETNESQSDYYNLNDNENDRDEDNWDKYSFIPPYQPQGGMTYASVEQSQYSQDLPPNILSPSLKLALMAESPNSKSTNESPEKESLINEFTSLPNINKNKLFANLQPPSQQFDLQDAFEFCSGNFPEGNSQEPPPNEDDSQYKVTRKNNIDEENTDSSDCDQHHEGTPQIDSSKSKRRIITFDETDDESNNDNFEEKGNENGVNIISDDEDNNYTKTNSLKKKYRLHFSDEDDDSDNGEPFNRISDDDDDDDDDEIDENSNGGRQNDADDIENDNDNVDSDIDDNDDQRSVYYDSEENEITYVKDFFEKEAELSGSECSGDEDEKGLDEYDKEAGDADNIDLNQVQSQLGKIHLRRLLDDDSRNVRLLQELLFEDGDLHTDENYKKFKWKNLAQQEEEQTTEGNTGNGDDVNAESSDEEGMEDLETRRQRLKRQLLVESLQENGEVSFECGLFKNAISKLKVTSVRSEFRVSGGGNKDSGANLTGLPAVNSNPISRTIGRGSFLKRNEELLLKLAKATSGTDNVRGPKHSKNFVFTTKSPKKQKPDYKRPPEETEFVQQKKKPKLGQANPAPSILDLLE